MVYEEIAITEEMRQQVEQEVKYLPHYPKNFKGQEQQGGDLAAKQEGRLGELVAQDWMEKRGIKFDDQRNQTNHDYLIHGPKREKDKATLEVKTKVRTVPPRTNFEATVPAYVHEHQTPNLYLFISLVVREAAEYKGAKRAEESTDVTRFITSYIVGGIRREEFDRQSVFFEKGQKDESNNWFCKQDCYNIQVKRLIPPKPFSNKLSGQETFFFFSRKD